MTCAHCKRGIEGDAKVHGDSITHADCAQPYRMAKRGKTFKCPKCSGSGWEYNRDVHSTELYDPADGYNGYFSPLSSRVVTKHESKRCDFCEGDGYLAKEPQPIVEPARVVGWQRG